MSESRPSRRLARFAFGATLGLLLSLAPRAAEACGGFFCSATNGVNQSAERIVFANNGDGTVTAVIEIQYDGPAASFSWLLPISSVPMGDDIAVSSNFAFQRLQQATNPQYNLQTMIEGVCDEREGGLFGGPTAAGGGIALSPNASGDASNHGVTVEAQGLVGSFEWTVISVDPALPAPADAAVNWLTDNDYDVPQGAPGLLGPYLQDGLYLLALKLQKGASVGSIRPIVLTYAADRPMIPIKLTAVAANDDMGVMAWILGDAQAVPQNYNALQLNDARINWFSANATYNQVVTEAADDAAGQGFVTEFAGSTSTFGSTVWGPNDEAAWQSLLDRIQNSTNAYQELAQYAGFDGFWEVVGPRLTLPPGMTLDQLKSCAGCYGGSIVPDQALLDELELKVIQPVRLVQQLIDAHPQMTRLYTTLSAAEMTVDPLFTFNPDLQAVSNVHTATRVIECAPGYYQEEAPWRIELPSGGIIRGGPTTVGTWPGALDAQPANERIVRQGESGPGKVLDDQSDEIAASLDDYNASVPRPPRRVSDGGSCNLSGQRSTSSGLSLALLGLGALWRRRRR